jgi:hypothetical protein
MARVAKPHSLGETAGFESGRFVVVDAEPESASIVLHDVGDRRRRHERARVSRLFNWMRQRLTPFMNALSLLAPVGRLLNWRWRTDAICYNELRDLIRDGIR